MTGVAPARREVMMCLCVPTFRPSIHFLLYEPAWSVL